MTRKRGQASGGGAKARVGSWLDLELELKEFSDGVHWVEPPQPVERALPPSTVEFYRRFGAMRLFVDGFEIVSAAAIEPLADLWKVGHALGRAVLIDGQGRVRLEDDEGETMCAASTLLGWAWLTVQREKLVYDKDGEFRDVFDEHEEGELKSATQKKRIELGQRLEPDAALYAYEAATQALADGDHETARELATRAAQHDLRSAAAQELLAGLDESEHKVIAAAERWQLAGDVAVVEARGADDLGWAATLFGRVAEVERSQAAVERALRREPGCIARWAARGDELLSGRELGEAQRLAEMLATCARTDEEKKLADRIRLRSSLRSV